MVVIDEIAESAQVFRSQTQIRLPQAGSDGVCEVVRVGGLAPETWSKYTGYPVKDAKEGVKQASSVTPYDLPHNLNVNWRVRRSRDLMRIYHQRRTHKQLK